MVKHTVATALIAGVAAAFLVLGAAPEHKPHSAPTKIKQNSQVSPIPSSAGNPLSGQVGATSAARLLFSQYGDPLYGLTVQALSLDVVALGARHLQPDSQASHQDMITCRDTMIAADLAINIMAVTQAYNLMVLQQVAPYRGEEIIMRYYNFSEDIDYLSAQLSQLRVACKNVLPGAGYVPEYDVMNNSGAEVRNYVSVALEEMGFHLGDLGDQMIEKPGTIQLRDQGFCKPMHEVAAALRPAMRDRPTIHHNKDHAANFDHFYGALKSLCPQYGPIY